MELIKTRNMELIQLLKPGTSRRNLLFIAALTWTFAGAMLFAQGILMMDVHSDLFLIRMAISLVSGTLFYMVLFSKLSKNHFARIIHLTSDRPCIFSFFNLRSYLLMTFMILFGVFLRKSEILPPSYLSILYVTMGIPLFVSSFRFYYFGSHYCSIVSKNQ